MSNEMKHAMSNKKMLDVVGRRIANIRKMRKMNQVELGAASGKMLNTISNIERGVGDPKITTLHAIAHALRVPMAELLIYEHPIVTNEIRELYKEAIHELRKLTPPQMQMACDIIKTIHKQKTE